MSRFDLMIGVLNNFSLQELEHSLEWLRDEIAEDTANVRKPILAYDILRRIHMQYAHALGVYGRDYPVIRETVIDEPT